VPSESELRSQMRDAGDERAEIDVARVIRRARARRIPRLLAVGGAACLVVAGVAVPVSFAALGDTSTGTTFVASDKSDAGDGGGAAPESATGDSGETMMRSAAGALNLCAGPLADPTPSPTGLTLSVAPVDGSVSADSIQATVTMTNTGDSTVHGTTAGAPSLALSKDGVVLWHSNGAMTMIAVPVDLAPGESLEYTAAFEPVRCDVEDDLSETGFRESLPSVSPGVYALSAAIDLVPLDGSATELVIGEPARVTLH
jgi:hypothetical protein